MFQIDYSTGSLEITIDTSTGSYPLNGGAGVFMFNNSIYGYSEQLLGLLVNVPLNSPYSPRAIYSRASFDMKTISQIRSYQNVNFIP